MTAVKQALSHCHTMKLTICTSYGVKLLSAMSLELGIKQVDGFVY